MKRRTVHMKPFLSAFVLTEKVLNQSKFLIGLFIFLFVLLTIRVGFLCLFVICFVVCLFLISRDLNLRSSVWDCCLFVSLRFCFFSFFLFLVYCFYTGELMVRFQGWSSWWRPRRCWRRSCPVFCECSWRPTPRLSIVCVKLETWEEAELPQNDEKNEKMTKKTCSFSSLSGHLGQEWIKTLNMIITLFKNHQLTS